MPALVTKIEGYIRFISGRGGLVALFFQKFGQGLLYGIGGDAFGSADVQIGEE